MNHPPKTLPQNLGEAYNIPEEECEPENFNKKKLAADYISDDYRKFLGRFGPFETVPLSQDREEVVVEEPKQEEKSTHLTEYYKDGETQHIRITHYGSPKPEYSSTTIQPIPL